MFECPLDPILRRTVGEEGSSKDNLFYSGSKPQIRESRHEGVICETGLELSQASGKEEFGVMPHRGGS